MHVGLVKLIAPGIPSIPPSSTCTTKTNHSRARRRQQAPKSRRAAGPPPVPRARPESTHLEPDNHPFRVRWAVHQLLAQSDRPAPAFLPAGLLKMIGQHALQNEPPTPVASLCCDGYDHSTRAGAFSPRSARVGGTVWTVKRLASQIR